MRFALRFSLSLFALARVEPALAFIDPPVFVPTQIQENQPFQVQLRKGVCDAFPFAGNPIDLVQLPGNRLQLFVTGAHVVDPIECIFSTSTAVFDLPALPAGDYQFELYIRNRANPFVPIHNGPVAPFTVLGSPVVSAIPTLSISGLLVLIASLFAAVWCARRHYPGRLQ